MVESAPPDSDSLARCVALLLEADGWSDTALRAAVEWAQVLNVELAGWYVEDPRLLALAQFPFAREADRASAVVRPLTPDALERSLRIEAARVEAVLREALRAFDLPWSFRAVREVPQQQLARLTAEYGVVVLAPPRAGLTGQRRRADTLARPVAAVIDTRRDMAHDLELAARWAARRQRPVVVAWRAPSTAEVPPEAMVAERLRRFGAELAAQTVTTPGTRLEDSLLLLNPEAVVLYAPATFADIDRLRTLAVRLRCPLVLVRQRADDD